MMEQMNETNAELEEYRQMFEDMKQDAGQLAESIK